MSEYMSGLRAKVGHDLLFVSASGTYVFDSERRVLLIRHSDGGRWTNPGGIVEPFDTPADAAIRETWEETGLLVELTRFIRVFGGRDHHITYPEVATEWPMSRSHDLSPPDAAGMSVVFEEGDGTYFDAPTWATSRVGNMSVDHSITTTDADAHQSCGKVTERGCRPTGGSVGTRWTCGCWRECGPGQLVGGAIGLSTSRAAPGGSGCGSAGVVRRPRSTRRRHHAGDARRGAEQGGVYRTLGIADVLKTGLPPARNVRSLYSITLADGGCDLGPLYREVGRVTKRGGYFVIVLHPQFLMAGVPTHFDRAPGEPVTIRCYVHLLSDHVRRSRDGWSLLEMDEGLVDDAWLQKKPKLRIYAGLPISFSMVWRHR
jgi:8-oxo-dGTP pyrophosphatase MutT (NUDIX family)